MNVYASWLPATTVAVPVFVIPRSTIGGGAFTAVQRLDVLSEGSGSLTTQVIVATSVRPPAGAFKDFPEPDAGVP